MIQEQATVLLIDSESSVKRALLTNITCLCVFFGRQKANDVLLSHMITYLNDKDWMLRSAFFESIKGVGTFVGARSLEEYILPLMIQALTGNYQNLNIFSHVYSIILSKKKMLRSSWWKKY